MEWSGQQTAIFDAAAKGSNVVVSADAGTGKSTLALELACRHKRPSLMLSFNTDIKIENIKRARELGIFRVEKKVRNKDEYVTEGHLDVRTFHGWGMSFFPRKAKVEPYKVDKLCEKEFGRGKEAAKVAYVLKQIRGRGFIETSVEALRAELRDPQYIAFGAETTDLWIRNADQLSELLEKLDADTKTIDFDDMCRMPVVYGWVKKSKAIPSILYLDEIQDLNPDQRRMVADAMIANPKVQVIGVGDDKQSIYGFRGAKDSMHHMRDVIGGVELPLNTTYRTHSKIVKFVNEQIDDSEMESFSKGGEVYKYRVDEGERDPYGVGEIARYNVGMIISSRNSTLISIWIELFLQGVDASLKGSGVIAGLKSQISSVSTYNWSDFVNTLREVVRANKRSKFVDTHADAAKGILEIIKRLNVRNKHELFSVLEKMNLKDTGVKLETVHSAKGREADRVAVICDWWESKDGQKENLRYVSFTRAKRFLMVVKPA